jgi:hypothetical protein
VGTIVRRSASRCKSNVPPVRAARPLRGEREVSGVLLRIVDDRRESPMHLSPIVDRSVEVHGRSEEGMREADPAVRPFDHARDLGRRQALSPVLSR